MRAVGYQRPTAAPTPQEQQALQHELQQAGTLGGTSGLGHQMSIADGYGITSCWEPMNPERRAEKLLLSLLSAHEQENWHDRDYCNVRGSLGGRYRLKRNQPCAYEYYGSYSGRYRHLCVYLNVGGYNFYNGGGLPTNDHILGLLLMLRGDEAAVKRIANYGSWS